MSRVLGYWNVRGFVDPIRFLLAQKAIKHEFKVYKIGAAPEFSKDDFRLKANDLGLDFPNLPYYIDGDVKLSQSLAILRYLGRKNGLIGEKENEIFRCDLAEQTSIDMIQFLFRSWVKHEPSDQNEIKNMIPPKLKQWNKFLGTGPFVLGDKLSYSDFITYTLLDYIRIYKPEFLDNHSAINNFLVNFEGLPNIDAFIKSDPFTKLPIVPSRYAWRGKS